MSDRFLLKPYELIDNSKRETYTTGVSLADCTIPFESILNTLERNKQYYRDKYHRTAREKRLLELSVKEYKDKIKCLDRILNDEFGYTTDELISTMED